MSDWMLCPTKQCTTQICRLWPMPPELLVPLLLFLFAGWSSADVVIIAPDSRVEKTYIDYELSFAAEVPKGGIQGMVEVASPPDACYPIDVPPFVTNSTLNWFVLIEQGNCSAETKVKYAQISGYHAAIIFQVDSSLNNVSSSIPKLGFVFDISAVLIGEDDGRTIQETYTYKTGYIVLINPESTDYLHTYLMPAAIFIVCCLIIMLIVMIVKCVKDRRRDRESRLSLRHLRHLPVTRFKSDDAFDVCAVCLEDYCDGEKIRILLCSHAFHTKCIDPWLIENRRNCPVCKHRVNIPGYNSESDSEPDERSSESTPLLRRANASDYQTAQFATSQATHNYTSNMDDNRDNRTVNTLGGVTVVASSAPRSLSYQNRLLCESVPGPSSDSGSYRAETSAYFNSSSTSSGKNNARSSTSSTEEDPVESGFHSRLLTLDNRMSV